MRVLVTGGSGFIGSRVTDKLRDHGCQVRVFDLVDAELRHDVDFFRGDVCDLDDLRSAMRDVDAIYHLAAIADVKDVQNDPAHAEEVNVRGTLNVLETVRSLEKPIRVIYGSTVWVYASARARKVDERTPLGLPDHFYTATKLAITDVLRDDAWHQECLDDS